VIAAVPIPSVPLPPPPPAYIGAPASAHPVNGVPPTPRNPHMAANGRSEIHNDGWQTDAYRWSGPLGRSPQTFSTLINRDCGSIAFDGQGRLVSVCVGVSGPQLYMFDPNTLATLATFMLPPRQGVPGNTYTKDPGADDPWYWTTIDFRSGRTVFKQFAGSNPASLFNNNYAGIALSPSGTAYLGTLGGIVAMRDGP
jgi:hypothetical protein